jgi:aspartate/methionine/tyrosine aminotransferase
MKHPSSYIDWYVHVPKVKHDLKSSGITHLPYRLDLGDVDLSVNYPHGNPETAKVLAERYEVNPENIFISSEGASGQNARIIRLLAEKNPKKNEAIVEFPTYEPLLRQAQEHFPVLKRLERKENAGYAVDADDLKKISSSKTGVLILTNPHAPSGAVSKDGELEEIMEVARERGFFVVCDEIYAEFERKAVPTISSVDSDYGIVTTSFTKAYGLGGLKVGTAVANESLVSELYEDVLNTVGNSPNVVQLATTKLLTIGMVQLEKHKQKWVALKKRVEKWFDEVGVEYFPNEISITYWVILPTKDTHSWINDYSVPRFGVAPVPGAFFLFQNGYDIVRSGMVRVGLGAIDPDKAGLIDGALAALACAMKTA